MASPFLGEFLGTMVLILLGNGVVAGVLLNKSKAHQAGWIVITAGWALAVLSGVFTATACGSSDAHLNPAVTLAKAVISGDAGKLPMYTVAQLLGAMVGAALVWLHYHPHWAETPEAELKLACFSTGPAIRRPLSNLISEVIGSARGPFSSRMTSSPDSSRPPCLASVSAISSCTDRNEARMA